MLAKSFQILCVVTFIHCAPVSKDDEGELVLLNIIFRHGARTTYSFYPNDPHKNMSFYPFGYGGLTNEGKRGEYVLGKYLRKHYGDFLGEDYTEHVVHVRSTDVTRTRMSAHLVLAGLYPPSNLQLWNPELKWQPALVNYKPLMEEDIFHRSHNCLFKKKAIEDQINMIDVKEKYIEPHAELYQYIEENSGKPMNNPQDMQDIFFNLKCEHDMELPLPNWTNSIFPEKILEAASIVYDYDNYNPQVRKINSGYMLQKLIQDAEVKINNTMDPEERKAVLYSGHEATIGYMLNALNLDQNNIPPYSSALSFELRKKDGEHFIKMRFRNDSDATEPIVLTLPGCDSLCPFEKFKELTSDLLPDMHINDACNQEYLATNNVKK